MSLNEDVGGRGIMQGFFVWTVVITFVRMNGSDGIWRGEGRREGVKIGRSEKTVGGKRRLVWRSWLDAGVVSMVGVARGAVR